MSIVKTINVAVTATTAKFEAAMKRSVISFDALTIASAAYNKVMGAVSTVTDGVAASMERIDTLSKAAASIGIATEELSRLRFAIGEIAGVGVEQTDAMLTRMIRTIAEGGKPAQAAMDMLGLSLANLRAMTPEQAFFTLTDAISQLSGQGAKASAAVAFFGKQGASLLPVFNQGSAAIRESAQFASEFGLAIGSVDAIAIENANDTLARLSSLLEGVYNQIAIELAPQIIAFGTELLESIKKGDGLGQIALALTRVGTAVNAVTDQFSKLGDIVARVDFGGVQKISSWITGVDLKKPTEQAAGFLDRVQERTEKLRAEMAKTDVRRNAAIGTGADTTAMAQRQAEQRKMAAAMQRQQQMAQRAAQAEATRAFAKRQREMEEVVQQRQTLLDKFRDRGKAITEATQTPIEQFAAKVAELQQLQRGGFISPEVFSRGFLAARQEFATTLEGDVKPFFDSLVKGPEAITGGPLSNDAFSAFQEAKRGADLQKEQLEYQKKMSAGIDQMVRRGVVLAAANLGGVSG